MKAVVGCLRTLVVCCLFTLLTSPLISTDVLAQHASFQTADTYDDEPEFISIGCPYSFSKGYTECTFGPTNLEGAIDVLQALFDVEKCPDWCPVVLSQEIIWDSLSVVPGESDGERCLRAVFRVKCGPVEDSIAGEGRG